jgi:hypothetical protein
MAEGKKLDAAFDLLFNLAMMMEWKADGTGLLQTIFILDGPFLF